MSDATEIKSCPSCGGDPKVIDKVIVWVTCSMCSLAGPYSNTTTRDAIGKWNALPRREEFYAELIDLSCFVETADDEHTEEYQRGRRQAFREARKATMDVAAKYASTKPKKGE